MHERAYLVVAAGEMEVEHDGEVESGGPGFLAHFDPNERHEVRATADSRIVLILAPWPGDGPSQPPRLIAPYHQRSGSRP